MRSRRTAAVAASSARVLMPSASAGASRGVDGDPLAARDELANRVGQVELGLSVLGVEPVERGPELVCPKDVDRGVDLPQRELVLSCVRGLDDRLERPVGVTDDTAVGAGLFGLEGEHRGSRALGAMGLEEPAEQLAGDRGGIAGDHEHVTFEPREDLLRRRGRVTRSTRLGLHSELDAIEGVLRPGRGDDHERLGLELAGGLDNPVDEPAPEKRVQVLGSIRAHARAEPGGQYDGCEIRRVHRDGWGARIRTWDRGTKTRCLTTWLRPTKTSCSPTSGVGRSNGQSPLGLQVGVASDASALGWDALSMSCYPDRAHAARRVASIAEATSGIQVRLKNWSECRGWTGRLSCGGSLAPVA